MQFDTQREQCAAMFPTLGSLARERSLLSEVLRAAVKQRQASFDDPEEGAWGRGDQVGEEAVGRQHLEGGGGCASRPRCRSVPTSIAALSRSDGLQNLPHELLTDIAEHFLDYPVWHLCQLGEVSPRLGEVFMDDKIWQNFYEDRFCEASQSSRQKAPLRSRSPSARLSYAQSHLLEARFRGGQYGARGTLTNPRQGVAVLDVRVAPTGATGSSSTAAFAALRDGSIMVYDLDPTGAGGDEQVVAPQPLHAAPLRQLTPRFRGGPALCCLPVEGGGGGGPSEGSPPLLLFAGFALGHLGAWEWPSDRPCAPLAWETAHSGRVSALAALGGGGGLLSASSDGLLKAWSLDSERFGDLRQIFPGHSAAVVSVAASPHGGGSLFLSGGHDRTMRLWDLRQGGEVARWRQQDWATCVDFHPTDEHCALSSDKSVHHWDLRKTGGTPVASAHRHRKLVSRFRADPRRLASCSLDGSVKVSSLEEPGVRVASPKSSPQSSPVLGPALEPDPHYCGALADGADVCTLRTSTDYVLCIDFDATRLLAGSVDGRVDIYDFTQSDNFRTASPVASPHLAPQGGNAFHLEMTGLQEPFEL